jgi:serine/threonine-protein kinase RsbW
MPLQLALSLMLPRDEITVPVARHIAAGAMEELGVDRECATDIEIALSEACTNVIRHSGPGDQYEVTVEVDSELCVIRVLDRGQGFDVAGLTGRPDADAEGGRGVELMRALVDQVRFESKPEDGTVVHLEKELAFADESVVSRLRHNSPPSG